MAREEGDGVSEMVWFLIGLSAGLVATDLVSITLAILKPVAVQPPPHNPTVSVDWSLIHSCVTGAGYRLVARHRDEEHQARTH